MARASAWLAPEVRPAARAACSAPLGRRRLSKAWAARASRPGASAPAASAASIAPVAAYTAGGQCSNSVAASSTSEPHHRVNRAAMATTVIRSARAGRIGWGFHAGRGRRGRPRGYQAGWSYGPSSPLQPSDSAKASRPPRPSPRPGRGLPIAGEAEKRQPLGQFVGPVLLGHFQAGLVMAGLRDAGAQFGIPRAPACGVSRLPLA